MQVPAHVVAERFQSDQDAYDDDGNSVGPAVADRLMQQLGPYGAAFMAGWSLRGTLRAPRLRVTVSAFIAVGAAAVAATSRSLRPRSNRASQAKQDLQALVRELQTGGDAAQRTAAQQLAASKSPANKGPRKSKPKP